MKIIVIIYHRARLSVIIFSCQISLSCHIRNKRKRDIPQILNHVNPFSLSTKQSPQSRESRTAEDPYRSPQDKERPAAGHNEVIICGDGNR
jgi:hypothetical protein